MGSLFVIAGAVALIALSVALVLFSVALLLLGITILLWDEKKAREFETILDIIYTKVGWLGLGSPFVIVGAAALIVLSVALILFSIPLLIFAFLPLEKLMNMFGNSEDKPRAFLQIISSIVDSIDKYDKRVAKLENRYTYNKKRL